MWLESVLDHSRRELQLLGLDHVGIDDVVVDFIKGLQAKIGNQPGVMKSIVKYVGHLIDKKPIAPITDADFDEHGRCTRYEYIYRAEDGKYYNDRAVAYEEQYVYQGQRSSKREITLPYVYTTRIEQ
jgi:hypothetical protein